MFSKWLLPSMIWICYVFAQEDDDSDCTCVLSFLCKKTEKTFGEGLIDIRLKDTSCSHYLETCCKQENIVTKPRSPLNSKQIECGVRHPEGVGYRVLDATDNEAAFGEFPWMVAIFHKARGDSRHMYRCGGSLIHPQVVLTAAHCIIHNTDGRDDTFKIRVGEWDSMTTNEIFPYEDREVVSSVIHSQYHNRSLYNDIGLLFLKDPVTITDHVSTVCLPPQDAVASGDGCFVTGWGKDRFDREGTPQVILKKIELPVVRRQLCQNAFRRTRLGRDFNLHQSFMCAGGEEGKDACTGDGGGPLVCPIDGEDNRYQQVGIVSWGIGCGSRGVAGAYADVARFRNWIEKQMKRKNLKISEK